MTDRFKFRVYIKYAKLMCYDVNSFYIDRLKNKITIHFNNYTKTFKFDDVVLEQCTGLYDKNGKLIYEGDIVKLSSDREAICSVVWDNEETGFCVEYKKELYRFNTYKKYHLIEVIGNIHLNADLLENESLYTAINNRIVSLFLCNNAYKKLSL